MDHYFATRDQESQGHAVPESLEEFPVVVSVEVPNSPSHIAGRFAQVSRERATELLKLGSHRLATEDEIAAFRGVK